MISCACLIVSSEPLVRLGLRHLLILEAGWRVCGEVSRSAEALERAAQLQPDLVVMCCQQGADLTLIRDLGRCGGGKRVLVVAHETTTQEVHRTLKAGALGYVMLGDAQEELLRALTTVGEGSLYVSQRAASGLLLHLRQTKIEAVNGLNQFSEREMEIFRLMGRALGSKQIAGCLNISVKTVETHKQRMKEKLNLTTCAELNRHAFQSSGQPPTSRRSAAVA